MVRIAKILVCSLLGCSSLIVNAQVEVLSHVAYLYPLLNRPDNHSYGIGGGIQVKKYLSDSLYGHVNGDYFFVKGREVNDQYFKYKHYNMHTFPLSVGIGVDLFHVIYIETSAGGMALVQPINDWGWQFSGGGGLKFQKFQVGIKGNRWNILRNFNFVGLQLRYKY